MGVRFGREYKDIIEDLTEGIIHIHNCYDFFGMEKEDWLRMSRTERKNCLKTLADDIFYGLGEEPTIQIGDGVIRYKKEEHVITISYDDNCIQIVSLI